MAEEGSYQKVAEMDSMSWRYKVMISFKHEDAPIWDMFVSFDDKQTSKKAIEALTKLSIQNWILNILNSLAEVKWFHTYSDYIVVLWLVEWQEKVREELDRTFEFSAVAVSDEEYAKEMKARTAAMEAENAEESVDITEE